MATWLWVRSEWRRSWPAVFGLALVVAVVVAAVAALWFGARRADSATDRFSAAIAQPNVEMQAPLGEVDPQSVAELNRHVELLPQAAEVPGVEAASATSWWALLPEGDVEPGQTVSPFVVGFSARAEGPSPFMVLDGELPPDDDPSSVVVNESMAETGVGVGSTIRLRSVAPADIAKWAENDAVLPDETHLTGPTIDAHVAAVVRLPDDLADARFPSLALLPGFEKAHGADVAHVVQAAQFRVDPSRLAEAEAALQKVYAQYGLVPVTLQDNLAPVRQAVAVEARTLQVAAARGGAWPACWWPPRCSVGPSPASPATTTARRALGAVLDRPDRRWRARCGPGPRRGRARRDARIGGAQRGVPGGPGSPGGTRPGHPRGGPPSCRYYGRDPRRPAGRRRPAAATRRPRQWARPRSGVACGSFDCSAARPLSSVPASPWTRWPTPAGREWSRRPRC